ncbi:ABC transporter ATP-binding protein [Microbacterium sp. ET2]|uniref:ABC transporter ATP-binding protein n=1 Tax=Microbacterium albipurpureum TaxID=3050384 RepID=UPI00259C7915|nr:ABC transporter ATP-binding protein [Microbacterium sp. ET2 (Ac-2212)]WJL95320.1 ABC transporter ATP-binding protein [Microbacterium sp. ET2 (Ac-2212)]
MTRPAQLLGVTKRFGNLAALDDVSLDVDAGECVGLLGPNGAGKTTALSLLTGVRQPSSGTVRLFGADPRDPAARRTLGSTPQATALPESLRVREVLELVAAHYPVPAPRDQIVSEFGLDDLVDKLCGGLSGGQQRRVAVAMAFVGDPRLVLLDEPTTGLDVEGRRALWEAVRARHAAGCTVIVTSHHLEEIEQLAERVVVIDRGRIRADDTLSAIMAGVGRRRVTLRGVEPSLLQALEPDAAITSIDGASPDPRALVSAVVSDADDFVRKLVAHDLPFFDLQVRGATLEEAFLSLTSPSAR